MNCKICCYTLFDITQTGILNRSKPSIDMDTNEWVHKRNTQCNFDTILQLISLRSQPELTSTPEKMVTNLIKFGTSLNKKLKSIPMWKFTFEVASLAVFDDGDSSLGNLYKDCHGVPMILCGTEWNKLPSFLDGSKELKNIYFEVINE